MRRCCGGSGEGAWMPGIQFQYRRGDRAIHRWKTCPSSPSPRTNGVATWGEWSQESPKAIPLLPCRRFLSEIHFLMGPTQMHSLVILHSHSAEDKLGLRRRGRQKESADPSYQSLRTGGQPLQPAAAIGQWLALRTAPNSGLSTPALKASRVLGTRAQLLGIRALSVPHLSQS